MGANQKLLVVAALKCERLALQDAAEAWPPNIDFATVGVGEKNARKSLRRLIEKNKPTMMLLFGTSGLIHPQKKISLGEIFLINRVVRWEEERVEKINYALSRQADNIFSDFALARLVTVRDAVIDGKIRKQIFDASRAELVDMESAAVCEIAGQFDFPLVILRVVSDNAGDLAEAEWMENLAGVLKTAGEKIAPVIKVLAEFDAEKLLTLNQELKNVHTPE